MGVKENVAISKAVAEAIELAEECAEGLDIDAFWKRMIESVRVPAAILKPDDDAMTDVQSRRFGAGPMEGRKHLGEPIDDVPLDYLYYFAETSDFVKELRRYLKSPRVQDRSRREG